MLDSNYKFVDESAILSRGNTTVYPMIEDDYEVYMGEGYDLKCEAVDVVDEEVVYLGCMRKHWGHFLIDCANRLWFMKTPEAAFKKGVFLIDYHADFTLINSIKRFLELYGLNVENILFLNSVTKYKKIIVPSVSYRTNDFYAQVFIDMFEDVAQQVDLTCVEKHEKIYFTRRNFGKAIHSEFGEELISDVMARNGYFVVAPEECTLDQQIAYIRNSSVVACINGTIAHNMLFAKYGQRIEIFNKTHIMNMMQMDINIMRRLDAEYVDGYGACFPVSLGVGPFVLVYNEHFKKFVTDMGYEEPDQQYGEDYLCECLKKYYKTYRTMYLAEQRNVNNFSLETSSHYYPEELAGDFLSKYYLRLAPLTGKEKLYKKGYQLALKLKNFAGGRLRGK